MTILDQLAAHAKERAAKDKQKIGTDEIRALAKEGGPANGQRFYDDVSGSGIRFICEVKKLLHPKGSSIRNLII